MLLEKASSIKPFPQTRVYLNSIPHYYHLRGLRLQWTQINCKTYWRHFHALFNIACLNFFIYIVEHKFKMPWLVRLNWKIGLSSVMSELQSRKAEWFWSNTFRHAINKNKRKPARLYPLALLSLQTEKIFMRKLWQKYPPRAIMLSETNVQGFFAVTLAKLWWYVMRLSMCNEFKHFCGGNTFRSGIMMRGDGRFRLHEESQVLKHVGKNCAPMLNSCLM